MKKKNKTLSLLLNCVIFFCLSGAIVFSSCSSKPKNVLPEDKMVSLLADMELAEAYASSTMNSGNVNIDKQKLARGVLLSHGVTKEELDSTLAWYGRNLDDYSALFEKVDKEILAKQKKILSQNKTELPTGETLDLWNSTQMMQLTSKGGNSGWVLSIDSIDLKRGDRLSWQFHFQESLGAKGILGVEYQDGTIEFAASTFMNKNSASLNMQTDTAKSVRRIFGSLSINERKKYPVFADSIKFTSTPYDSLEYSIKRGQKKYSANIY